MVRLEMKNCKIILTEKQQKYQLYHLEKLENLTDEDILTSDQRRVIEQATFTYSPLKKTLEKQRKTIEDQVIKQAEALKALKPEENQNLKSIEELFPENRRTNEIRKWEEKSKRNDLKYKTNKHLYDFQQFETIRSFGHSIYTGKINIQRAEMNQSNLLENIRKFNSKSKLKTKEGKAEKRNTFDSANTLYEGQE